MRQNAIGFFALLILTSLFTACDSAKTVQEPNLTDMSVDSIKISDPNSFANFNEVRVTHLNWSAGVNFDQKTINARAIWTIERVGNNDELILDTKNLNVHQVWLNDTEEVEFRMGKGNNLYGQPLIIPLKEDTKTVKIAYSTNPEAGALQWLDPVQTAGKEKPFLFTQSQAILARTWLPCQDGPGVRFTYDATVTVPSGLLALMSAENPTAKKENGSYTFSMDQPVPSYLMALAVGDLEYKKLGEKSGVYAEPSVLPKAANEFENIPEMIRNTEALYGPYQWGQYDVLVLPPSFPFGGMENPRLTFATPTILAGDKSLMGLVAHELAHSWSGNLVTNANWEDIWINEGFTTYIEHRIMEASRGREYSEMLASLTYQDLIKEIEQLNDEGRAEDTRLHINLEARDPDEGLTGIPYNKGYLFLRKIEETVGRETWDAFLSAYFSTYTFHSINSSTLVDLLNTYIVADDSDLADTLKIDEWVYGEGLPDNAPVPVTERFQKINTLSNAFIQSDDITELTNAASEWTTHEWLHFINNLPNDISIEKLQKIDEVFDLTHSSNAEIQAAWYLVSIRQDYEVVYPEVEDFLIHVGRRKFLTPLYTALVQTDKGRKLAEKIYKEARPNYHPVSYQTIDKIVSEDSL
ncbi:M1 family metallopeptidase [Membranicola marinus]|uniref:Aminopeptidase N n=1 Tax=Membranihabitans marinus TaxID=1227546 RepID=A0A953HZB3_9BACT|nr:M1 family metallopeptidase [Membranihabitans marinus]MBY5958457.1 M1 family metallopeptidase [Membranihabitans marinus]